MSPNATPAGHGATLVDPSPRKAIEQTVARGATYLAYPNEPVFLVGDPDRQDDWWLVIMHGRCGAVFGHLHDLYCLLPEGHGGDCGWQRALDGLAEGAPDWLQ